jgi:hypothetical protein
VKFASCLTRASVLSLLLIHPNVPEGSAAVAAQMERPQSPVIVELFTSEGCSTCPPADALLEALASRQPVAGAHIIALEEHVDYWNGEGWADPFSSIEWTLRQQEYVSKFKQKEGYTPQMVVDGQKQLVGSNETEALEAIQESASVAKTIVSVTVQAPASDGFLQFHVRVARLVGNTEKNPADVWLALTESGLRSAVSAGENSGRDLHHGPVLRMLRKIGVAVPNSSFAFEDSPRIKFKPGWKQSDLQVVIFVQERKSRRILGAAVSRVGN